MFSKGFLYFLTTIFYFCTFLKSSPAHGNNEKALRRAPRPSCFEVITGKSAYNNPYFFESPETLPAVPVVVTLGPGTAYLEEKVLLPLNPSILRINFSHVGKDLKRWSEVNGIVNAVSTFPSALLADNPGPKIRITNSQQVLLHPGMILVINREGIEAREPDAHGLKNLTMPTKDFDWITEELKAGSPIIIGDDIQGETINVNPGNSFSLKIVSLSKQGYILTGNKGIQAPGVNVNAPALTSADFANTDWLVWSGRFQGITISFIRDGSDVVEFHRYMEQIFKKIFPIIRETSSFSDVENLSGDIGARVRGFIDNIAFRTGKDSLPKEEIFQFIKEGVFQNHELMPMIWAKVETVTAMRNLESIVSELSRVNGGIIVARGDLLIQTGRNLPAAQFLIVYAARKVGIPVVVATGGFSTPATQSTLTPSDTIDVGTTSFLRAGLMVSEQTAMASDEYRLHSVVQHMNYVARQSMFAGNSFKLGLSVESAQDFEFDRSALPDYKTMALARDIVGLARGQSNSVLGKTPVVFESRPSEKLIQAIRILDWGLPLLVVDRPVAGSVEQPVNNSIDSLGQSSWLLSRKDFMRKKLRFYPFVFSYNPESSRYVKPLSDIVQELGWGSEKDVYVVVRPGSSPVVEKPPRKRAEKVAVAPGYFIE